MAKMTAKDFEKYKNTDPGCTYPFEPDPLGYCWSYAHHTDGNPAFKNMKKICEGCELYVKQTETPNADHK